MSRGNANGKQLILLTQIYNEDTTLSKTIDRLQEQPGTSVLPVNPDTMDESDWDKLLHEILSTSKVIVL